MSCCQYKDLKRKSGAMIRMESAPEYMIEAAIATTFIKDWWDLRFAVIRYAHRKTIHVAFVLNDVVRTPPESPRNTVLTKSFVLQFPVDPELWIDTTSC